MAEKKISILLIIIAIVINFITARYFGALAGIGLFYMGTDYFDFLAYLFGGVLGYVIIPMVLSAIVSIVVVLFRRDKSKFIYYFAILFLIFSLFALYICYQNVSFEKSFSIFYRSDNY